MPHIYSFKSSEFDDARFNQEFTERKEINEFLRDGVVVSDLYDITLSKLFSAARNKEDALKVFNTAYRICFYATIKKMSYSEISRKFIFERNDYIIRDLSYCVAWVLLSLHIGIYDFDETILQDIRCSCTRRMVTTSSFSEIITAHKRDSIEPINFASSKSMFYQAVRQEREANGPRIIGRIDLSAINKATSRKSTLFDDVKTHTENILDKFKELDEENKKLRRQLLEQKDISAKELESERAKSELLKLENKNQQDEIGKLQKILDNVMKERNILAHSSHNIVVNRPPKDNPISLSDVFNCDAITDYGCSLPTTTEVTTISTMISKIALRKQCTDPKVTACIDRLDEAARSLHQSSFIQNNNFSQGSAYNDIHDNPNSTITTNGKR